MIVAAFRQDAMKSWARDGLNSLSGPQRAGLHKLWEFDYNIKAPPCQHRLHLMYVWMGDWCCCCFGTYKWVAPVVCDLVQSWSRNILACEVFHLPSSPLPCCAVICPMSCWQGHMMPGETEQHLSPRVFHWNVICHLWQWFFNTWFMRDFMHVQVMLFKHAPYVYSKFGFLCLYSRWWVKMREGGDLYGHFRFE